MLCLITSLMAGEIFSQAKVIHRKINDRFSVDIYLPSGYHSSKSYKTIYFNDGEAIFSKEGLALDEQLDQLIAAKTLEPIIAVGIYSAGNRLSWYTPYEDEWIRKNWGHYTPQAEMYTQGIVREIIPFIEKNYAVEKGAAARAIAGFSMGGLHATWAGLKFPETFSYSIGLSPSYWVAEKKIFSELNKKNNGSRFWFDLGTGEWEYYVPFYQQLQQAGYEAGRECFYYEVKDGRHTPADWSQRLQYPLLVFAGADNDLTAVKMDVIPECIPSQVVAGRIYRRVNAVVTLANGIRYSLSNTARYTLLSGDIKLAADGTFSSGNEASAVITVAYKNLQQRIKFSPDDCKQ